jgi:fluoroquinolone transport system permease protein
MGNLLRLVAWDVRLQSRENVYLFTVFTTSAFAFVLLLLPGSVPHTVVTGVLFLDPAVVGMSFVGSIVLMERSQNTLAALSVTPASARDYVLSKILTLTALTFAGGMALVAVAYHPLPLDRAARFVLAMGFTGCLGVLVGLAVVARSASMNHFIARLFPITLVAFLPLTAHFGAISGAWMWGLFAVNPGHAMLRALLWAADPTQLNAVEPLYAFGYMGALIAFLLRRSTRRYATELVRPPQ